MNEFEKNDSNSIQGRCDTNEKWGWERAPSMKNEKRFGALKMKSDSWKNVILE